MSIAFAVTATATTSTSRMPPKAKALEKAALNQADKDRKAAIEAEKAEEAEWSKGAKDSSKSAAEAEKDAEKRRKAAEKAGKL